MLKLKILAIILVLAFLLMPFNGTGSAQQVAAETVSSPALRAYGNQQTDGVKPKVQPTLMPMFAD